MNVNAIHRFLGIPPDYGLSPFCPRFREAEQLVDVGADLFGRPQKLSPAAGRSWAEMRAAARTDRVDIHLVSGFRSIKYQCKLFERKLAAGQIIDVILRTNAAPGFSQHHTGHALDLGTAECEPLTEAFEDTEAFRWLVSHAHRFGFSMPYPSNNRFGFIYEPWHWVHAAIGI